MAKTEKYQGWTNYETWVVKLWIDQEEGDNRYWREAAQEIWEGARADKTFSKKERAVADLSDRLKGQYEEAKDDMLEQTRRSASVWADLLGGALQEVDWREIAESLLEDMEE